MINYTGYNQKWNVEQKWNVACVQLCPAFHVGTYTLQEKTLQKRYLYALWFLAKILSIVSFLLFQSFNAANS